MNHKDVETKKYLRDKKRFADLFNVYLYEGEQVIKPEELEEKDVTELLSLYYGIKDKEITKQKWRDLLRRAVVARAQGAYYVLLGIENQSDIHYAMPVKSMIYDAINYGSQVEEARRTHEERHREEGTKEYADSGEFLSGYTKTDRLTPVITLVVYWGSKKWDGPLTLHEMLRVEDEQILKYVPDYKINLLEPCDIMDFSRFRTSVGEVLEVIKVSDDKNAMEAIMKGNKAFEHLEADAVRILKAFTDLDIEVKRGVKEVNMSKAWDDWRLEGKREGRLESIKNLMESLNMTAEQAMDALKIDKDERARYTVLFKGKC